MNVQQLSRIFSIKYAQQLQLLDVPTTKVLFSLIDVIKKNSSQLRNEDDVAIANKYAQWLSMFDQNRKYRTQDEVNLIAGQMSRVMAWLQQEFKVTKCTASQLASQVAAFLKNTYGV